MKFDVNNVLFVKHMKNTIHAIMLVLFDGVFKYVGHRWWCETKYFIILLDISAKPNSLTDMVYNKCKSQT